MKLLRAALACALILTAVSAWAASSTINVALNQGAWVDLGAGPLQIVGFKFGPATYAVSDSNPALGADLGFPVPIDRAQTVNTASHVWARATTSSPTTVTVAPVIGPGVSCNGAPTATFASVNGLVTSC